MILHVCYHFFFGGVQCSVVSQHVRAMHIPKRGIIKNCTVKNEPMTQCIRTISACCRDIKVEKPILTLLTGPGGKFDPGGCNMLQFFNQLNRFLHDFTY